MLNKTIKNKFNIELLFVIIPFLFGLFYDFAVFAVAISFLIIILLKIFKDKKIKIYFNCCFISEEKDILFYNPYFRLKPYSRFFKNGVRH